MTPGRFRASDRSILLSDKVSRRGKGRPTDVGEGELKARIFREAARLFAERGYRSATVEEIVKAADATKPVLYYYFKNKEGLYRALLDRVLEDRRVLIRRVEQENPDPHRRLVALFLGIFSHALENAEVARFTLTAYFAATMETPEVDTSRAGRELFRAFRRIAELGIEEGSIAGNPFEIARVLLGVTTSYLATHLDGPQYNLIGLGAADRIVEMVWDGIGSSRSS